MLAPDQTRQQAVFERLRAGILSGALTSGARLPPTRALAAELGVARQTVVLAYERLAAEGYVRGRIGSGTYVAGDLPDAAPAPGRSAADRGACAVAARTAAGRRAGGRGGARSRRRLAAGRRTAGARPVPRRRLGALHRPGAEGAAAGMRQLSATAGPARAAQRDRRASRGHPRPGRRSRLHRHHRRHPAGAARRRRPAAGSRRRRLGGGPRLHRRPRRADRGRRHAGAGAQRHGGDGCGGGNPAGAGRRDWPWWRRRTPRRWVDQCRSAAAWRCWTGRRAPVPGCWKTTAIRNSAGKAGRCRHWPAWIAPGG